MNRIEFRDRVSFITVVLVVIFGGPFAVQAQNAASNSGNDVAVFAGGCFWCVESDFDHVPGVVSTVSGYTGGHTKDPTYKQVTGGGTGHIEAVEITFDPAKVSYERLVEIFWRTVDPVDGGGQFCDRGESYTTAIFTKSELQATVANASKQKLDASGKLGSPIATRIVAAGAFYPAEDYHQDYYQKNPVRYKLYRYGCGRDARVEELWGEEAHQGLEKH